MKKFLIRYTEDFGMTYKTEIIEAKSFTDAYFKIYIKLTKDGAITELFEVME